MADAEAKRRRSKHKDARQAPAPEGCPKRRPGKKDRPIEVESRFRDEARFAFRGWYRHGRYRNMKEAEAVVEQQNRKYGNFMEFRVKPQQK